MKLKVLHRSRYTIAATVRNDRCETEDFLSNVPQQYVASRAGLLQLIDRISEDGLDGLSPKLCHLVDRKNKIYELIKGDLRLLFFKGHCDVLIITVQGFIKKSQKTPSKPKEQAIECKKHYQKAHDAKQITWVEDE